MNRIVIIAFFLLGSVISKGQTFNVNSYSNTEGYFQSGFVGDEIHVIHFTVDGQIKKEFRKKVKKPIITSQGASYDDYELDLRFGFSKMGRSGVILRLDRNLNEVYFSEYSKKDRIEFPGDAPDHYIPYLKPAYPNQSKFYKGKYYLMDYRNNYAFKCYRLKSKEKYPIYELEWERPLNINTFTDCQIIHINENNIFLRIDAYDNKNNSERYHHDYIFCIDVKTGDGVYRADLKSDLARNISLAWYDEELKKVIVAGDGKDGQKTGYFISAVNDIGEFEDLVLRENPINNHPIPENVHWKTDEAFLEFSKVVKHETGSYSLHAFYMMPRDIRHNSTIGSYYPSIFGFAVLDISSSLKTKSTILIPHMENAENYILARRFQGYFDDFTSNGGETLILYSSPRSLYLVKIKDGVIQRHHQFSPLMFGTKYILTQGNKMISLEMDENKTYRVNEKVF